MSNNVIDFDDFTSVKTVPLIPKPDPEFYTELADATIAEGNLGEEAATAARRVFQTQYEKAEEKYRRFEGVSVDVKRIPVEEYETLADGMDAINLQERQRVKDLRVKNGDDPGHECHSENFSTKQYAKDVYNWRTKFFMQTVEKIEAVTVKGKKIDWGDPEAKRRFFLSLSRTGLGSDLQLCVSKAQYMKWEDLFP